MASISRRPNGTWQARYRAVPRGPQKSKVFARKVDAQRWLDEMTGEHRHRPVRRSARRSADLPRVRRAVACRPGPPATTAAHVETMLRRHVYPSLGDKPLSSVLPERHPDTRQAAVADLAPATVGVVHRILAAIFKAAVRDRRIVASPCVGTRLPKIHKQARRAAARRGGPGPDRGHAGALPGPRHARRRHRPAAGRSLRTDRRPHRLPPPPAEVDRQLVTMPDRAALPGCRRRRRPRSGPSRSPRSSSTLSAAHLATWPTDGFVFTTELGDADPPDGVLGRRLAAGGPAGRPDGGVTFHALRHFYASLLIRHGESVKTVQARLGHASPPRRSTPTATSGPTPTTGRGPPWTRCSSRC